MRATSLASVGRIRRSTTLASMTRLLPEGQSILTPEYQLDYILKTEVRRPTERFISACSGQDIRPDTVVSDASSRRTRMLQERAKVSQAKSFYSGPAPRENLDLTLFAVRSQRISRRYWPNSVWPDTTPIANMPT